MEKNKKIQIYCLLAASLFLGLFGAVCLYLGVLSEYDDAMGYFNADSVFAPVAYICMAAGPIFGILAWVLFRKSRACDKALPCGILTKVVSCVAALLILFATVSDAMALLNEAIPALDSKFIFYAAVSVLAAAALVACSFAKSEAEVSPILSFLSFAPVIYCAVSVLYLYFDQDVAVNSPAKLICQLTYLSFMLVFCAETGLSLGRGKLYPRYIFTLCCALAVGGAGAVSALIVTLTGANCTAFAGVDSFVKVGLFLYACARFASFTKIQLEEAEEVEESAVEEE